MYTSRQQKVDIVDEESVTYSCFLQAEGKRVNMIQATIVWLMVLYVHIIMYSGVSAVEMRIRKLV